MEVRVAVVRRVIMKHKHARRQFKYLMTDYYPSPSRFHTHAHKHTHRHKLVHFLQKHIDPIEGYFRQTDKIPLTSVIKEKGIPLIKNFKNLFSLERLSPLRPKVKMSILKNG